MVKVLMHGCNGRMGQMITSLCKNDPEIEIVAGVDSYTEVANDYPVFTTIDACDVAVDAVIDFSNASAVDGLMSYCVAHNLPVVLCSTGLSEAQLKAVDEAATKIPVLRSANMSLGINLLMSLLQKAVQVLDPAGFDVEIVEKHHKMKLDAPSGTALALADAMNDVMDKKYDYVYNRSDRRAVRGETELGISAVRGGTIVGEHEVIFAGTDEVIEIKHTAYSRSVFGKGAMEAAKFIAGKQAGMYDMSDVIGEN